MGSLLVTFRRVHRAALLVVLALGTASSAIVLAAAWSQRHYVADHWESSWVPFLIALALCVLGGVVAFILRAVAWRRGRWTATSLAPWRGLFVVGVATTAVYLGFFQPFKTFFWSIVVTFGFGVWAWAMAVVPAVARQLPARLVRAADFVLFLAAFTPFSAEVVLRIHAAWWPSVLTYQVDVGISELAERNRMAPGKVRMGFPLDERGSYDTRPDPPPRAHPLVATIGDSFSLGVVPHAYHFTTVCERELPGVEVYNAGVVAVGPPAYLYLLRKDVLELEPDVVLVNLFIGNDVVCEGQYGEGNRLLRLWFDRENSMLATVPQRWARLRRERAALGDGALATESEGRGADVWVSEEDMPWLADPRLEPERMTPERFMYIEGFRAHLVCRPGAPVYAPLFRTLQEIVDEVHPARVGFVLIPDEFQVEDDLWRAIRESRPSENLERDLPQERIRAWLGERGHPCLDLLPELRAVEPLEDGRRYLYHLRDTHFNARGNEVAGRALAEFLRSEFELGD